MKNIKSEKGAITILVLVTMLFMVSFLITTYIFVSNKAKTQTETIQATKALYEAKNAEEEYESYFGANNSLDEYTKLYMSFNKEIQDESGKQQILNIADTISIHDNQYIGGFAANQGITFVNSEDFNLGSEDFTLDFWVKFTNATAGYQAIFDRRDTVDQTGWLLYVESNNTLSFVSSASSRWNNTTLAGAYPISNILDKWTHVAIVRYGNIFTMYINGNAVKTGTYSGIIGDISINPTMGIGHSTAVTSQKPLYGYLNEFRISKGIARWIENFTPPTPNIATISKDNTIPIYTVEQLLKIGSNEIIQINETGGKYYKFSPNNKYILMNDFEFDVDSWQEILGVGNDWTSIGDTEYFFEGNGHIITVTNLNDEIIDYNTNNKYSLKYILAERTGIDDATKLYMSFNEDIKDDANKQTILNIGNTIFINDRHVEGFTSNNGITLKNSEDFNLGSEDFTIDFWVKFTNATVGYQTIFDRRTNNDATGWLLYVESNNTLSFLSSASTRWNNQVLYSSYPISNILNKWTHVALVRHENVFTMYINGTAVKSGTYTGTIGNVNINPTMGIGHAANVTSAKPLHGYLDEFRINKGIAKWTENFEVPQIQ